ncbi:MAG: hypothetical protein ACLFMO_04265 [Eubacteriales bacterium]
MKEVIKRIIDIENGAQELLNDTEIEKEKKYKDMKNTINKMKDDYMLRADNKITQLRKQELKDAKNLADKQLQEANNQLQKIEEYANENLEEWVNKVVSAVLEE